MSETQKAIDWEVIELDYRLGIKTLRQIAEEHEITHGAINKRAKKFGWERDLSAKVQAKAKALVSKAVVSEAVSTERLVTEKERIESEGQAVAARLLEHRRDISRTRKVVMSLLDELEIATDNRDLFEKLGELLYAPDDNGRDRLNEIYHKVMSMPSRTTAVKQLSDSLKTVIGLEREALGVDSRHTLGETLESLLEKIDG